MMRVLWRDDMVILVLDGGCFNGDFGRVVFKVLGEGERGKKG